MHNLLEPKNKTGPFFLEFWQYLNVCIFHVDWLLDCCVQDTFTSWDQASWNRTVLGAPKGSKDPRFTMYVALVFTRLRFRKMNCAEKTVRNKIGKMTYLHIYFDSYGVTKFTKSQRFGWQVGYGIGWLISNICRRSQFLWGATMFRLNADKSCVYLAF